MRGELSFVSVACNRLGNCAAWSHDGLLAYGAGNFVALYDYEKHRVRTLRGHTARVNCVSWINENELISGSTDKTLLVWKRGENDLFYVSDTLAIHSGSVTSLSVLGFTGASKGKTLVVSTSADRTVAIWLRSSPETPFEVQQHEALVGEAVECCALHLLPATEKNNETPLLALGGVGGSGSCRGSEIILFLPSESTSEEKMKFSRLITLKGHEDWIRCLSFVTSDDGSVLLASSAQDNFIRLWKIETSSEEQSKKQKEKTNDIFASLEMLDSIHSTSMSQQGHTFQYDGEWFSAILESVLYGHEDWVYSVYWHPRMPTEDGNGTQPLCLLSASMDKTMMIWRPQESENGVWINEVRVGELGGNTLGFYGGLFSPDAKKILAHGYNGAFHLWGLKQDESAGDQWEPLPTVSGHFAPVNDCCWHPSGDYFITIGQDQTARIFSTWKRSEDDIVYTEVSRPQIHGYDLECGCFINGKSHSFVTGAEEKIYRVFDAPQSFIHNLQSISGKQLEDNSEKRPLGANVPSLGLSNKPVFTIEDKPQEKPVRDGSELFEAPKPADPVFITRPPFEEELLQSTLWPEIQKLYGHGNYTFCVTSSPSGDLLATAVHAKSDPEQASIRLWETNTWKEVANLRAHKLTVTQLSFSNSDKYLLSSGRDRQFSLFKRIEGQSNFELVHKQAKAHERILWSCDWSPDDKYFVTGSRDKTCKLWSVDENTNTPSMVGKFSFGKTGVTAVAFAPRKLRLHPNSDQYSYLIAVGLETGLLQLWSVTDGDSPEFSSVLDLPAYDCHCDAIKRIRWDKSNDEVLRFISCSSDHSVRLFTLTV